LLASHDQHPSEHGARAHKNRRCGQPYILHTLAIADFRLALQKGQSSNLKLLEGEALPRAAAINHERGWTVRIDAFQIGVTPDHVFALGRDGARRYYMVEIDRGTMPIQRETLQQTSVLRKLLAYEAGRRDKLHERLLGWKSFRVLILANTPARARNIHAAIAQSPTLKLSPLFLVSDLTAAQDPNIFEHQWLDAEGKPHNAYLKQTTHFGFLSPE
jgi:hypothetical protein